MVDRVARLDTVLAVVAAEADNGLRRRLDRKADMAWLTQLS